MHDLAEAAEEGTRRLRETYGTRLRGVAVRIPEDHCDDCDEREDFCDDIDAADIELLAILEDGFNWAEELSAVSDIASIIGGDRGIFMLIWPITRAEFEAPPDDLLGQMIREAVLAT